MVSLVNSTKCTSSTAKAGYEIIESKAASISYKNIILKNKECKFFNFKLKNNKYITLENDSLGNILLSTVEHCWISSGKTCITDPLEPSPNKSPTSFKACNAALAIPILLAFNSRIPWFVLSPRSQTPKSLKNLL